MDSIKLKAFAKINLGLDVVKRREDGYHEVKMVMQTVRICDKVSIQKSKEEGIELKTNLSYLPVNENNLVYKAANLIKREFCIQQGVKIQLEKYIPVSAGMAGGSTDAAAVLVGMNRLFHLHLSKKELMKWGLRLGADVPYCVMRGTALSEGIGEILTPLPAAPACYVVVVKPPISVSTRSVYEGLDLQGLSSHPDMDGIVESIRNQDLYGMAERLENVLETVTIKEYPMIDEIKIELQKRGAIKSLMSGSGPSVFGLFDDLKTAKKAFHYFYGDHKNRVFLTDLFHRKG